MSDSETESTMVGGRQALGKGEKGELVSNEDRVSVGEDENALELDGGDG